MKPNLDQTPLVIWGASGHAMVVADIVWQLGVHRIVGFLDNINRHRHGDEYCGVPILGGEGEIESLFDQGVRHILLGIGDCQMRLSMTKVLEDLGFSLPVVVHPRATVAKDVELGAGTVIVAGAVVNSGSIIGKSVIVNTLASIDHECIIGDAVHISPGVHLAGQVVVGQAAWVGIGTNVKDRVSIGAHSIIGTGSAVVDDIPENVVAFGVPARIRRMTQFESQD